MGFERIQSVTGVTAWEARETALFFACWADALGVEDPWYLLEACGLVPYVSGKPPKARAEKASVIKYPRPGQS